MNKKAFTLMELMVVILIIAILAAVAIPIYNSAIDNQNNARAKALLQVINGGMDRFQREYPNVSVPMSPITYVSNIGSSVRCTYSGSNNLSAEEFVNQMQACGYIPRYNYTGENSIEYRFRLQDPNRTTNDGFASGYVYMEPKNTMTTSNKYCRPLVDGDNITCTYKAGITFQGEVVETNI